jgi:ParB/RepB/Spo0J family partition protein
MLNLPIDQLKEHPKQGEFFKPLEGRAWEEFYTDLNARGIQQPVIVSDRTGDWVIADGHQRVRAAKYLGWLEVPCIIGEFTDEREEVRCLVMNNARRRQLSREEIESIIGYWLANYTHHSNRRIAEEIGVSHVTVEAKREQMETGGQIDHLDKLEGADGKSYPRSKPKREPITNSDKAPLIEETSTAESYAVTAPAINGKSATYSKGVDSSDPPAPKAETVEQNVYETYDLAPTYPVPPPIQAPGWQSTEIRKELERAATILTRMDSDEGREEIARDRAGTLRPFLQSAYKQLGEMLEATHEEKVITLTKSFN